MTIHCEEPVITCFMCFIMFLLEIESDDLAKFRTTELALQNVFLLMC